MIFHPDSHSRIEERHWVTKFTFRLLTLTCVIISIGTAGYAWPFAWWMFIPLGISFFWNIANIAVRLSRPRPMVPGANVGMDLVLWLMFLITVAITYVFALAGMAYNGIVFTDANGDSFYSVMGYTYSCTGSTCADLELLDAFINNLGLVALVAAVFGTLAFIGHFILFVFACVDTHHRRAARHYGNKEGYRNDAELANRTYGVQQY